MRSGQSWKAYRRNNSRHGKDSKEKPSRSNRRVRFYSLDPLDLVASVDLPVGRVSVDRVSVDRVSVGQVSVGQGADPIVRWSPSTTKTETDGLIDKNEIRRAKKRNPPALADRAVGQVGADLPVAPADQVADQVDPVVDPVVDPAVAQVAAQVDQVVAPAGLVAQAVDQVAPVAQAASSVSEAHPQVVQAEIANRENQASNSHPAKSPATMTKTSTTAASFARSS